MNLFGEPSLRDTLGTRYERFVGIVLFIAFLLPHTSTLMLLVNPILAIILFICGEKRFNKDAAFPIISILLSLILCFAGVKENKTIITAVSIMMYMLMFPIIRFKSIKNIYLYVILLIIAASQLCYVFHISPIISILERVYPITWNEEGISTMIASVDLRSISSFRNGGLYRNPNQLAKFVTFLLGIFISINSHKTFKEKLPFIAISIFLVLLTGSRTGFIVVFLMALAALYFSSGVSQQRKVLSIISIFVVVVLFIFHGDSISFRGAGIKEGIHDSAGSKLEVLLNYISNEQSVIRILFGNIDHLSYVSGRTYSFDAEYGYIIYDYGFVGLLAFAIYYYRLYRNTPKQQRLFFIILLWMVSSSIFMAFRAEFIFVLLASAIYGQDQSEYENDVYLE